MPRPTAAIAALSCFACAIVLLAAPAAADSGWSWPALGEVITQYRNGADPYADGQHRGIDIAAEAGTPVVAAAGGTVRFAGVAGSSGLTVAVRTADGRFDTSYLHLGGVNVREGDAVSAGGRLGSVGTSGRRSAERSHLHFGVREAGTRHAYVDPLTLLGPPPSSRPPEAPRVTPAPAPAPVAPAPVPVPGPVRPPAARRLRLPAGRRVPAARPAPVPGPLPAFAPAPDSAPAQRSLPAMNLAEDGAHGRAAGVPQRVALPGLGPSAAGAPARASATAPRPAEGGLRPEGGGPDVGWALACLGLLLAAAMMGRTRDGGRGGQTRGAAPAGAPLPASSIGSQCRSTSQRPSTT